MLFHYVMCVAHNVCVMLGSSSMFFLVSFCYVIMGEKIIIIVLSQHSALSFSQKAYSRKHYVYIQDAK